MLENQVNQFLYDMTYSSSFQFLEEATNDKELKEIAKECNIVLPSIDLAIFKCVYAYIDKQNKNGCTLPKEEVEQALPTLNSKSIDFDHFRKRCVGHWLKGKIEDDKIIAYGVFYKSSFADDYDTIKGLFTDGTLAISFEAWGEKVHKKDGYELTKICFAGGALLIKEQPAFDGAEVLEMAKGKVLEFAKVMTKPDSFIHTEPVKDELPELARYYVYDVESIMKAMRDVECPSCKGKGMYDVQMIDFAGNKTKVKCACEAMLTMDLTPIVKMDKKGRQVSKVSPEVAPTAKAQEEVAKNWLEILENAKDTEDVIEESFMNEVEYEGITELEDGKKLTYKERKNIDDKMFVVVKEVKNKVTGASRKIRMFPIHDPAHVRNSLSRLAQEKVIATLKSLGVSIDNVKQKILKRAKELNMKDLLEKYEKSTIEEQAKLFKVSVEETSKLKTDAEVKEKELATIKESVIAKDAEIATLKTDLEAAKKDAETAKAEIAKRDKEIRDAEIAKRKTELGDIAKDMTDEDVMNEDKYKIAKLTKENADLKAKVEAAVAKPAADPAKGSEEKKPEADLDKGSKDKNKDTAIFDTQKRVTEKAFGKETK